MRQLLLDLAYLIPLAAAVVFMLWVLWNFTREARRQ
jgi:hypothetical protein